MSAESEEELFSADMIYKKKDYFEKDICLQIMRLQLLQVIWLIEGSFSCGFTSTLHLQKHFIQMT